MIPLLAGNLFSLASELENDILGYLPLYLGLDVRLQWTGMGCMLSAVGKALELSLSWGSMFSPGLCDPVLLFLSSSSSSYFLAILVASDSIPKQSPVLRFCRTLLPGRMCPCERFPEHLRSIFYGVLGFFFLAYRFLWRECNSLILFRNTTLHSFPYHG